MNSVVSGICNIDVTCTVYCYSHRCCKLTVTWTSGTKWCGKCTRWSKYLNDIITGICNVGVTCTVYCCSSWTTKCSLHRCFIPGYYTTWSKINQFISANRSCNDISIVSRYSQWKIDRYWWWSRCKCIIVCISCTISKFKFKMMFSWC